MQAFRLTLVLTHACDLACTYCSAGPKDGRRLDESLGRRAIERALATLGGAPEAELALGFFGGEPLLEWPLARRLLAFARERAGSVRVAPSLTTNGTRVDERVARELVLEGVETALSLDGLPEVHDAERVDLLGRGSSGKGLRALENLVAAGAMPRIVSVVRPGNVERLPAGIGFLIERGARAFEPSLDWHASWRREDAPRLVAAIRALGRLFADRFPDLSISWLDHKVALLSNLLPAPIGCGFGRSELAVAPSGRLYPCERLVQDDRPGPWAKGHVADADGPFVFPATSCAPRGDAACGGCSTRPVCSNGCACANLARTGRPDRPDGLVCLVEQASLDAAREALELLAGRAIA